MYIKKLVVKNFKCLRNTEIDLNEHLSIIVGGNEAGKSTLLEAVNLVLMGQLNGRNILYDVNPFLFNQTVVKKFFDLIDSGKSPLPPAIVIEAYFENDDTVAKYLGMNNSLRLNCPGLRLAIEFNDDYKKEYKNYIDEYRKSEEKIRTVPIEYYNVNWRGFDGNAITSRTRPFNSTLIDTSLQRYGSSSAKYINKIVADVLSPEQRVDLSLSYRKMKEVFAKEENVAQINAELAKRKGSITDKELTVSIDLSSRFTWESSLTAHLNDIPIDFSGKGEESSVKMKLAMESADNAHIFLIEEPENHLTYANMSKLVNTIKRKSKGKQVVITTHSSYVLNKLGIHNAVLFTPCKHLRLKDLSEDTFNYFIKLPGYDTLRIILAEKAILVEGPSDELVVQKAYKSKHGKLPIEDNVDVISVGTAFLRFLEIAEYLQLTISVVTDNDQDVTKLERKYKHYLQTQGIKICYDEDENYPTLEPQLLKANSLAKLNTILGTKFQSKDDLLQHMKNNKTDCALKLFLTKEPFSFPRYIEDAI